MTCRQDSGLVRQGGSTISRRLDSSELNDGSHELPVEAVPGISGDADSQEGRCEGLASFEARELAGKARLPSRITHAEIHRAACVSQMGPDLAVCASLPCQRRGSDDCEGGWQPVH